MKETYTEEAGFLGEVALVDIFCNYDEQVGVWFKEMLG
jgi:hypothetical protein